MADPKLLVGDIGGTNAAFGLCDEKGTSFFESSLPTASFSSPEELVDAIYSSIEAVCLSSLHAWIGLVIPVEFLISYS